MAMTEETMGLIERVEKQADGDLVREMLALAAERIMDAEPPLRAGAATGARTPVREVQRNGYRDCDTRAGRIALEIPKLRKGSYFASFLEPEMSSPSDERSRMLPSPPCIPDGSARTQGTACATASCGPRLHPRLSHHAVEILARPSLCR